MDEWTVEEARSRVVGGNGPTVGQMTSVKLAKKEGEMTTVTSRDPKMAKRPRDVAVVKS